MNVAPVRGTTKKPIVTHKKSEDFLSRTQSDPQLQETVHLVVQLLYNCRTALLKFEKLAHQRHSLPSTVNAINGDALQEDDSEEEEIGRSDPDVERGQLVDMEILL